MAKEKLSLKERLEARQKDIKSRGQGGKFFTIKEGTNRMRPLPVGEDEEFGIEVTYFWLGQKLGGVVSPSTFGEPCAIKEKYTELSNSKNEDDRKFASKLKPKSKFMMPHIKYKDEKGKEVDEQAGPKLLILTPNIYNELIELHLDTDEAGDFTNIDTGYDIKYRRTGKGMTDTEYSITPCKPTALKKPWRKEIYNPEEMVRAIMPTYKETKAILKEFLNTADDDDAADDKEEVRKKKKKNKNKDL